MALLVSSFVHTMKVDALQESGTLQMQNDGGCNTVVNGVLSHDAGAEQQVAAKGSCAAPQVDMENNLLLDFKPGSEKQEPGSCSEALTKLSSPAALKGKDS